MAIADFASYEAKRKAPHQRIEVTKDSTTSGTPGQWHSGWKTAPFAGANPPAVTGENPTNTTTGALGQTDGATTLRLLRTRFRSQSSHTLVLCDRLSHISGLDGTSAIAQLTAGMAVSRYTGSASKGNWLGLEIYTQIGATGTTVSASYTDQDGNALQTTQATVMGGTDYRETGRVILLPLAQGDSGVRDVASVTLAATTGTAGNFGATIFRPLIAFQAPSQYPEILTFDAIRQMGGLMPEIQAGACLFWMVIGQAGTTGVRQISMRFAED